LIWYFSGMKIGLLSAPSNLGLRPPAPTSVLGCARLPRHYARRVCTGASLSSARKAGVYRAGRRRCDPGSLRSQVAIIEHARRLAERIDLLQ
jgi:arginase